MSHPPDTEAIAAIRGGEIDRYRELIERYERQVYAVAWSRLGDAALAEEAVQESFIRAYRLLSWLRDPARFAGWITRIARGVAINLGVRHCRELRRRERWSLDPAIGRSPASEPGNPSGPNADPEEVPAETLRRALADLPANHRECLVLHYLEGRSVADAARALGVTEGAFRVRLHRARAALRVQLEKSLAVALGELKPRRSLAPGIMSSLALKAAASDPGGLGSGLLAAVGAGLAKLLPAPFLVLLLPFAAAAAGFGAFSWAMRVERRNYRDPEGFRVRLYDDFRERARRLGLVWGLFMVLALAVGARGSEGRLTFLLFLLPFLVLPLISCIRRFQLDGQLANLIRFASLLPLFLAFTLDAFVVLPGWFVPVAWGLQFLGMAWFPPERPLRFDYNLFLRHRLRLLPEENADSAVPATAPKPNDRPPRSPRALLAFARHLSRHSLVVLHRRVPGGFEFKLHPVCASALDWLLPVIRRGDSTLTLRSDGTIDARLGANDRHHFDRLDIPAPAANPETAVERAVARALDAFLAGRPEPALQELGQSAEAEIFGVDPARGGVVRFNRIAGVLGVVLALFMFRSSREQAARLDAARAAHLFPSTQSLAEIRTGVGGIGVRPPLQTRHRWDALNTAAYRGLVLPPVDWLAPEAREYLRTNFLEARFAPPADPSRRVMALLQSGDVQNLFHGGWITTNDLVSYGLTPEAVRATVTTWTPEARRRVFFPEGIEVVGRSYTVLTADFLFARLRFLRDFGCLDLLERAPLVELLRAHQVLPDRPLPEGRRADLDRALWNGHFVLWGDDPIRDSYFALGSLEILGGLEGIDRTACADAVLRYHRGRGLFLVPTPGGRPFARRETGAVTKPTVVLFGDARSTYMARESLRILGALGRVEDLAAWEFRTIGREPARGGPDWDFLEAGILRNQFP